MENSSVLLLSGESGTGKTTILRSILRELKASGVNCGGMLAHGRYLATGEKEFDLELIPREQKKFLSSRIQYSGWDAIGGFWFNPEAVEAGLEHLQALPGENFDLFILDEIGPFELEGYLWAPMLPDLINTEIPMIWTVRSSILKEVSRNWGLANPEIVITTKDNPEEPIRRIKDWLKKNVTKL